MDDKKVMVFGHDECGYVRLEDHMGSDNSILRSARVSYGKDGAEGVDIAKDDKLIRSLWKRGHTSPFEACTMTFEVSAPIFVFRQWHRHRTWSFNEISARYTELPDDFYVPAPLDIGQQMKHEKQMREVTAIDDTLLAKRTDEVDLVITFQQKAYVLYMHLIQQGWPRELARSVLPVSIYSRMYATVNLLNLFKFIKLRSDEHAQFEIRVYSDAMLELARTIYPRAVEAFEQE